MHSRGGKGIKTCNITEKNGELVSMKAVTGEEDIMLITTGGVFIRMAVSDISTIGRSTQGVRLIRLDEGDGEYVATVAKVEREEEEPEDAQGSDENDGQGSEGHSEPGSEEGSEQNAIEESLDSKGEESDNEKQIDDDENEE